MKKKIKKVKTEKKLDEEQARTLAIIPEAKKEIIKPQAPALTLEDIKKYINSNVNDKEAFMFLQLCKSQNLNPFINEAYLIKYGTGDYEKATMVVGKDVFTKRASHCREFNGFKAGVILDSTGNIVYREGSFYTEKEILLGGWAEVYRKDQAIPIRNEVRLDEYEGRKKDGTLNKMWKEKPGTMIRKVALMQSLREAFPDQFQGLYDASEMGVELSEIKNPEYIPSAPEQKQIEQLKPETKKEAEKPAEVKYTIPQGITPDTLCNIGPCKSKPIPYKDIHLDKLLILWEKSVNPSELEGVLSWSIRANMEVKLAGKQYDWDKFLTMAVEEKLKEYVKIAGEKK